MIVALVALTSCGAPRASRPVKVGTVVTPPVSSRGASHDGLTAPASLGPVYDGCGPSAAPAASSAARHATTLVVQSAEAGTPSGVAWSPDGRLVATSDGKDVSLWDAGTGELRGVLSEPLVTFASHLAFSPDGATLAAAGEHIVLWDLATGAVRARLATFEPAIAVLWSVAGDAVGAITRGGSMNLWDARDGSVRASGRLVLPGGWNGLSDATISRDGARVVVRSVWNELASAAFPASGTATPLEGEEARARAARDVAEAVTARRCGGRTWDADSVRRHARTSIGVRPAFAMSSRDGSRLLAVSEDGVPIVWDVRGGRVLSTPDGTPFHRRSGESAVESDRFELSDDGSRVQAITVAPGAHGWEFNYTVRVWSAGTGRLESKRTVAGSGVEVHASRDGSKRAFLSKPYYLDPGYRLFVGGVPDALVASLAKDRRLVFEASWSSDGRRLSVTRARGSAAVSGDVVHEVWDVATGRRVLASVEEKSAPRFVVDDREGTIRVVRQSDGAWMTLMPLFGPRGPELVVASSVGEFDVSPATSSLVRFRLGADLRTSPVLGASDPRVHDELARRLHRSLASAFLE